MLSGRKSLLLKSIVFLLLFLFPAFAALAQGGERSSSPGIPGQKPLSFVSISLVDGGQVQNSADVPTEPRFKLTFDKNVVNSTVWENNRRCFSLFSENGENIPLKVTKVDDTIDFSQRQNVFVQPTVPLSPGTSYTLKISPDLRAKNGVSTLGGTTSGQGVTVSFKTRGQAAASQPAVQTVAGQPSGPDSQPVTAGGQGTAQTNSEGAPPQAGTGSDANGTGGAGSANTAVRAGSQDSKLPAAAAEQRQAAAGAGGESAGQAMAPGQTGKPENPAQAGVGLNYTSLLTIFTVVLIAGWVTVEVLIKRKRKGF